MNTIRQGDLAPDDDGEEKPHVTPKIAAEAAMWVARLHGPSRSRKMELKCLEWQARSKAHQHAFERCTETWMEVPNAARAGGFVTTPLSPTPGRRGRGKGRTRRLLLLAGLGAVMVSLGALGLFSWRDGSDYQTAIGEARTVVLDDGTRMSLNTDTRVTVAFQASQRSVVVSGGEAVFEVAKDARRPFVVRAGSSEVVALGTVFSVRLTPSGAVAREALAVTLLEGQISVRSAADGNAGVAPAQALLMNPGDRVRLVKEAGAATQTVQRVDRPRLDQVMAWKRNEAIFDKASLTEAVEEMNRYSRVRLVLLGDLPKAEWRVSGQFRTGDNAAFANALATLHGLVVRENQGQLELSLAP